jgi:hypothetical protein
VLRIYPSLKLYHAAETINAGPVRTANTARIGFESARERCTTWEIRFPADPGIWLSPTLNIAARNVTVTSMPTWTIWPCPRANIPAGWCFWPCDWWWRMACRTDRPPGIYGETIGFSFRGARFKTGSRRRGEKSESSIQGQYLTDVLADFSGYIAADELYDGPFCVLFIVDNHKFKRLYYEVLDHNPTHADITSFFKRFQQILDVRGLTLKGITTDGSPLYPEPIVAVFGKIPHQICQFHVIKEITKAILKAVTQVRKELKQQKRKCSRGRPSSKRAKRTARKNKRIQNKIADLFEHRYLFVKHKLTAKEKRILQRLTRGLPHLRTLRTIMEEVYRLFDRRCRTDAALEKVTQLRRRVSRFKKLKETLKKLFSPNLEKALTFLDDSLLPSTSNAVERANRRHRKMQKSIYRVRTREHISQRIAIDMQRDSFIDSQNCTINTLHHHRTGDIRKTG